MILKLFVWCFFWVLSNGKLVGQVDTFGPFLSEEEGFF